MTASGDLRVMFCTAAGPRRGFGHLVRCLSLARALGIRPLLALRGSPRTIETAIALGADVLAGSTPRRLAAMRPDVVIVDDPVAREGRRWIDAARLNGARVVTVHDLGIGCAEGDLVVDGSIARTARAHGLGRALAGTRFAVLDPFLTAPRARRPRPARRVLIALGGGPHLRMALAIGEAVMARVPHVEVRIATGFVARTPDTRAALPRVTWVAPTRGLAEELSQADVAVVGGGVSLYEACALGVPSLGVPVVKGQVPTVRGFARQGAAVGVPLRGGAAPAAAKVIRLLGDAAWQRRLSQRSRRLVDGRGAARVAAAVEALAGQNNVRLAWEPTRRAPGLQPDRDRAA